MKLAYCAVTPDVTNPGALGYGVGFGDDFARTVRRVAELGFDGVELMMANPAKADVPGLYEVLREHGLPVPMVCTGEVFGQEGLGLAAPDPAVRAAALDRIKSIVRVAGPLGAQVNLGRSRGHYVDGVPAERTEQWAEDAFRALSDYAADFGVTIALEPIARHVCNFINSTQDGLAWVARVDRPNFRLMFDVYHMNIDDTKSIPESIREAARYTTHVHLCDTNRRPPGWAHLDFDMVIAALREAGYSGFVSAEVFNYPDQEDAIRRSAEVLRPIVRQG